MTRQDRRARPLQSPAGESHERASPGQRADGLQCSVRPSTAPASAQRARARSVPPRRCPRRWVLPASRAAATVSKRRACGSTMTSGAAYRGICRAAAAISGKESILTRVGTMAIRLGGERLDGLLVSPQACSIPSVPAATNWRSDSSPKQCGDQSSWAAATRPRRSRPATARVTNLPAIQSPQAARHSVAAAGPAPRTRRPGPVENRGRSLRT